MEAVTVWNLLGSFDWDSLLTRADGRYETGVFDISEGAPRKTALAALVRDLALDGDTDMALATETGWWRRPQRLLYPPPRSGSLSCRPREAAPLQAIACQDAHPELLAECERRGLRLDGADDGAAWRFVASETPTRRALDLLIDQRLSRDSVPSTRHRDTGGGRRV